VRHGLPVPKVANRSQEMVSLLKNVKPFLSSVWAGKIRFANGISRFEDEGQRVYFRDGYSTKCDAIIMCTGKL